MTVLLLWCGICLCGWQVLYGYKPYNSYHLGSYAINAKPVDTLCFYTKTQSEHFPSHIMIGLNAMTFHYRYRSKPWTEL
ncbi:hypothetical protein BDW67DRAFT_162015 [Aspergillus spinulosporus]